MNSNEKTTLQFDDSFFKEDIIADYKVTEKAKRVWAIELDLLNQLLCVCNKYNIKVFVFAGTLLGTIRHKGFIPWDDDIDVCLTRKEYEKLISVAEKEFKEPYFFQTALTDKQYFFAYARLRNSKTTGHILKQKKSNYNHGIYIDIFVLDGYIPGIKFQIQYFVRNKIGSILSSYYGEKKNYLQKVMSHTICKLVPYEKVVGWYNKNLSLYNDKAEKLTLLTHRKGLLENYWCYKQDLDNVVYMPFENLMVPVPANYDIMLKRIYGNYMEYPPLEKRGLWHEGILMLNPDVPYEDYFKTLIE